MMSALLAPLLIGLIGASVLLGLGKWQLDRLAWKEGLIAGMEQEMARAPRPLGEFDEFTNYAPVSLSGEVLEGHIDVLASTDDGVGFRRILPVATSFKYEYAVVLVEMGHVSEEQRDAPFDLVGKKLEIEGHIFAPREARGSYDATRNIWVGYDVPAMAAQFGALPLIVIASRSPTPEWEDRPLTIELPNNHLQYAITWFSLALVWSVMALYWGVKRMGWRGHNRMS